MCPPPAYLQKKVRYLVRLCDVTAEREGCESFLHTASMRFLQNCRLATACPQCSRKEWFVAIGSHHSHSMCRMQFSCGSFEEVMDFLIRGLREIFVPPAHSVEWLRSQRANDLINLASEIKAG
jgi:hypothetical protein